LNYGGIRENELGEHQKALKGGVGGSRIPQNSPNLGDYNGGRVRRPREGGFGRRTKGSEETGWLPKLERMAIKR